MKRSMLSLLFVVSTWMPAPVAAQGSEGVEVMVLGTFHFAAVPEDLNDVLAPEQQAEVQALVDSLARFQPTKVAVELIPADSAKFDSLYHAYRAGRHDLSANERQQIGLRLAARFGHERVYAIDHKEPWPNHEAVAWAREHRSSFLDYYQNWREARRAVHDSLQRNATIREILLHLNGRKHLLGLEELRMRKLELGLGSEYPGVAPVRSMYDRDLHIFANLTRIAQPGDRILVIYGSGHVYHLREFIRNHPKMRLVRPAQVLAIGSSPATSCRPQPAPTETREWTGTHPLPGD